MYGWKNTSAAAIIESEMSSPLEAELSRVYTSRFDARQEYRRGVWSVLVREFFQPLIGHDSVVLDLGCGYGEFINAVAARKKFGMDLNPRTQEHLAPEVTLLRQDCSSPWAVGADQLDVVFTSNFFEHLPNKEALAMTLEQAFRALRPGGRLIAMGPNIKFTEGRYWDFWDHYLPLTDLSLAEGMTVHGFNVRQSYPRFLPYTMVGAREYPLWAISWYLRCPWLWRWKGEQFLVIAQKP